MRVPRSHPVTLRCEWLKATSLEGRWGRHPSRLGGHAASHLKMTGLGSFA